MTPEELRAKNPGDLRVHVNELKEELFKLSLQKSIGQLEKTHRLKEIKKDLARVYTLLREETKKDESK